MTATSILTNEAPCFADDDYVEDDIIEALTSKCACQQDSHENDDDDLGEVVVTHTVARHSIQLLRRYFVERGFSHALRASLDMCAH